MAVKFISSEITQHRVKFNRNKEEDLTVTLTRDYTTWTVEIVDRSDLTVSELIDICNLFYSENVIDPDYSIEIFCNNSDDRVYIRNRDRVSKAIIEGVKVTLPKKDKK